MCCSKYLTSINSLDPRKSSEVITHTIPILHKETQMPSLSWRAATGEFKHNNVAVHALNHYATQLPKAEKQMPPRKSVGWVGLEARREPRTLARTGYPAAPTSGARASQCSKWQEI